MITAVQPQTRQAASLILVRFMTDSVLAVVTDSKFSVMFLAVQIQQQQKKNKTRKDRA